MTSIEIYHFLQGFFAALGALAIAGAISLYGVKKWINGSMDRWLACATELKDEIRTTRLELKEEITSVRGEWGFFVGFVADVSKFMREHGWKDGC